MHDDRFDNLTRRLANSMSRRGALRIVGAGAAAAVAAALFGRATGFAQTCTNNGDCPHPGSHCCNGTCVDTKTDPNNCGRCGNTCGTNETCTEGKCTTSSCPSGQTLCNAVCVSTATDVNNCGACGHACSATNGTPTCTNGVCGQTCNAGFATCGSGAACTTNINTDPNNCGACGHVCNATNGTPTCTNGLCGQTCNAGFGACVPGAGCTTNLNTDPNNCGACGHVCATGHSCTNGVCV
jgi:Stigma-specific protein, Stig1